MSPDTRPGAPNAARGIVIVVIAGLVGVFLLGRGGTSDLIGTSKSKSPHVTTTVVANVPTIPPETSTTPPPSTTPPADVTVAIFNATGGAVPGAAGNSQAKLTPLGYEQVSIHDTTPADASAVYYTDGHQADAKAIAGALGIADDLVAPASGASNIPAEGQGVSVVVVIGKDAASTTN